MSAAVETVAWVCFYVDNIHSVTVSLAFLNILTLAYRMVFGISKNDNG